MIWDSCFPFSVYSFGARNPRLGFPTLFATLEPVFSNCLTLSDHTFSLRFISASRARVPLFWVCFICSMHAKPSGLFLGSSCFSVQFQFTFIPSAAFPIQFRCLQRLNSVHESSYGNSTSFQVHVVYFVTKRRVVRLSTFRII